MRPLAGVKVVDAGLYISAPFAALQLADLGAEVTKVEPPGGEPLRRFGQSHGGIGYVFAASNANKRSVVLDLKASNGAAAFAELLSSADVLISNWRPRVAEGLGLTAESARTRWPQLVWVRVTGYGQDGPRADFPAFDSILQAKGGGMGGGHKDPALARGYVADKVTAVFAAQSALAALHVRRESGTGVVVDVSMLDAMAYWNAADVLSGQTVLDAPEPDVLRQLEAPSAMPTKDGWLVVAAVTGKQLKGALGVVGHPEWIEQLRATASPADLVEKLYALLATVLPERTSAEWEAAFRSADIPAASVLEPADHFDDEQVVHNRTYRIVDDPTLGRVRRVRHPGLFDGTAAETDDLPVPPLTP